MLSRIISHRAPLHDSRSLSKTYQQQNSSSSRSVKQAGKLTSACSDASSERERATLLLPASEEGYEFQDEPDLQQRLPVHQVKNSGWLSRSPPFLVLPARLLSASHSHCADARCRFTLCRCLLRLLSSFQALFLRPIGALSRERVCVCV